MLFHPVWFCFWTAIESSIFFSMNTKLKETRDLHICIYLVWFVTRVENPKAYFNCCLFKNTLFITKFTHKFSLEIGTKFLSIQVPNFSDLIMELYSLGNNIKISSFFFLIQNFTLAKEELGMTTIGDLSEEDMVKVRSLALIELTALFDTYTIPMNRKKAPSKLKFKGQFVFVTQVFVTQVFVTQKLF